MKGIILSEVREIFYPTTKDLDKHLVLIYYKLIYYLLFVFIFVGIKEILVITTQNLSSFINILFYQSLNYLK